MYRISLLLIGLFFFFIETTSAQLRLDVEGNAKIRGKLDVLVDHANTFVGFEAGLVNQDGSFNTFLGWRAGKNNSSGNGNTFIGSTAGKDNTIGSRNTIIGQSAGTLNTTGENNTFIGTSAGLLNTEGSYNVFLGHASGVSNKTGTKNTFVGEEAGYANTTGAGNTFLGKSAGESNTSGAANTFLGEGAGESNTSGFGNTFLGQSAGTDNVEGSNNTFLGRTAGLNNTANNNTFLGYSAGLKNTTGYHNVFIGYSAGYNNEDRSGIVAVGSYALFSNGDDASFSFDGTGNTAVGIEAGFSNTTGNSNTFLGEYAGFYNTTGIRNTYVGSYAGLAFCGGCSENVFVGYETSSIVSNTPIENAFVMGNRGLMTRSHSGTLGNLSMQRIGGYVNWSSASDGRMKKQVREDVHGLDFILQLRPVSYQLDALKLDNFLRQGMDKLPDKDIERSEEEVAAMDEARQMYQNYLKEKANIRYTGFIAQEVEKAMQQSDFDFSGLVKPAHEQDHYSLRYAEFVVPLVKGMQEQQKIIGQQEERIKSQEQRIRSQEARLAQVEALLQQLNNTTIPDSTTDQELSIADLPKLYPNQPNPFGESTLIRYYLPKSSANAEIRITNVEGQLIKSVPIQASGEGQLTINANMLSAGTYFYSLMVNGELIATQKMVFLDKN